MSQPHVEQIIGRLVTDDQWRARYRRAPDITLDELVDAEGLDVTLTERRALHHLPLATLDALAECLDARVRRLAVSR